MLKVEHLSYEIEEDGKKQEILKDVSFEVKDGEMLVVTGPNGGGKSTIAKLMMGLYKATEGKIWLDGQDITSLPIYERAKAGIGFAFQQPPRFKGMTVRRLLSLAAGTDLPKHICCGLLSRVGLCAEEYLDREVDATLSGGEMKRIEIATVLVKKHKLCIFDEPEAGIDLWSFAMLVEEFQKLHTEKKESLLLISHQERIIDVYKRQVYRQLMKTLEDAGVKQIEALGQEFNPDFHNAVMHVEDEEAGENIIVEEFQKGYMYRDSVVRHSMVKVAN